MGNYVRLRAALDSLSPALRQCIVENAIAVYGHGEVRSYVLPREVAEGV